MHRDSHVREGDDAGRVSPFATPIGMIAALTKDKKYGYSVKQCERGGRKRIDEFFINFALIRTLYRAHDKRRLLSRYGAQPQRLHALLPRPKGRERCKNKVQWGDGYSSSPSVLSDLAC